MWDWMKKYAREKETYEERKEAEKKWGNILRESNLFLLIDEVGQEISSKTSLHYYIENHGDYISVSSSRSDRSFGYLAKSDGIHFKLYDSNNNDIRDRVIDLKQISKKDIFKNFRDLTEY